MFVQNYYSRFENSFSFSKQQASDFAKGIADDFNPLHDSDNKRFCVPGDLLFSLILSQFGVSEVMEFEFLGMVNSSHAVHFVNRDDGLLQVEGADQKCYMRVCRQGRSFSDAESMENLIRQYVAFSGQNFPHILVGLMQQENVMINPLRPMVVYKSMSLKFDEFKVGSFSLDLAKAILTVEEKRGIVDLEFRILVEGQQVGTGTKQMLLGGLREYQQKEIDQLVTYYNGRKRDYLAKVR